MYELIPNVNLPEGRAGQWAIEKMIVDKAGADFHNLRESMRGGRMIYPGEYTKITRNGSTIMSDVPAEKRDHIGAVRRASGRCLINGLGIGMVLNAMLMKPEVTRVTVVEISKDVMPWSLRTT